MNVFKIHPPPPGAVHAGRYGQQAGGTHRTGMHSCFQNSFDKLINVAMLCSVSSDYLIVSKDKQLFGFKQ